MSPGSRRGARVAAVQRRSEALPDPAIPSARRALQFGAAERPVKDYHINIFWSDEDDCYVADIPDLRFCSAFGSTPEEALAEVEIAKRGWLKTARQAGKPV